MPGTHGRTSRLGPAPPELPWRARGRLVHGSLGRGRRDGSGGQALRERRAGRMTQSEGGRGRAGLTLNLKHDPQLGGGGREPVRVTACAETCENDDLENKRVASVWSTTGGEQRGGHESPRHFWVTGESLACQDTSDKQLKQPVAAPPAVAKEMPFEGQDWGQVPVRKLVPLRQNVFVAWRGAGRHKWKRVHGNMRRTHLGGGISVTC